MTRASFPPRLLRWLALFGAAPAAFACRDLDNFSTKPGDAYCGTIIGSPAFQDGFLREGTPPDLELALTLDTSKLTSEPGVTNEPGVLRSGDAQNGLCAAPGKPQALFEDAPLRTIPKLEHDVLSALSFGEGHEYDFFAWVDSSCQGTMLAVVSLMKNSQVEVRLFKPAPFASPNATSAEKPGFAVFHLDPQKRADCGF